VSNSDAEFDCWFIENPTNKELQKHIDITLEAGQS
jgi:hypothetical protein